MEREEPLIINSLPSARLPEDPEHAERVLGMMERFRLQAENARVPAPRLPDFEEETLF